jgi:predicted transcriptional regulator of viral defense system
LFEQHNGIVGSQELLQNGLSYHDLNGLLESGAVIRLKRGIYKWATFETNELAEVARMVPNGVFCLLSAAFHHGLTTTIPVEHQIAILDTQKVVLPDYPPIKLYYWNKTPHSLGVSSVEIPGGQLKMYNLEKTVCDAVGHRNKIGFETLKEILKNYLDHKDRNLNRLHEYSQKLNIFNKLDNLIKVLL